MEMLFSKPNGAGEVFVAPLCRVMDYEEEGFTMTSVTLPGVTEEEGGDWDV